MPKDWLIGNVFAIYKQGCGADPGKCKLVSLFSFPDNMIRSVIEKKIKENMHERFIVSKKTVWRAISFNEADQKAE